AGRRARDAWLFLVLSKQEPRGVRRRRAADDQRRSTGRARATAAQPWHAAEVPPPRGRREFPDGRAAGRRAEGEAAKTAGVDGRAARERRALPGPVQGRRTRRHG